MTEFRENRKRPGRRPLQGAFDNVTTDSVELQKVVIVLENEQRESELIENQLVQEVESLREHVKNLKMEKQQEEKRLRATIKMLKAELYDMGLSRYSSASQDFVNENVESGRKIPQVVSFRPRTTNISRPLSICIGETPAICCVRELKQLESDSLESPSNSGVIMYDRLYALAKGGPSNPVTRGGPSYQITKRCPDVSGTRDLYRPQRRTHSDFEVTRRKSSPVSHSPEECTTRGSRGRKYGDKNHGILNTLEEIEAIEAAARAFLSIFGELKTKLLRSLWSNLVEIEKKNDELVLDIRHLPRLLHRLVVFAYVQDHPHQPPPSPRQTKPLISLLKVRLAPHVGSRKYLTFEHFKNFARWLQQSEELLMLKAPSSLSSQNQTHVQKEDPRRHLKVGSACFIWSEGGKRWCEGEVIDSKFDDDGEWLVVRYCNNSKWSEKEVQRYSTLVWAE